MTNSNLSSRLSSSLYKAVAVLLAVLSGVVFLSCVKESTHRLDDEGAIVVKGQQLPEFNLTLNDGGTLRTADLAGRPSLIVFFNTQCGDCRKELPIVNQIYADYANRVQFVCISRSEGAESVSRFWEENHLTMPYSLQSDRTIYSLFALRTIPRIYLSDASLKVQRTFVERVGEKALRKALDEVLQ